MQVRMYFMFKRYYLRILSTIYILHMLLPQRIPFHNVDDILLQYHVITGFVPYYYSYGTVFRRAQLNTCRQMKNISLIILDL